MRSEKNIHMINIRRMMLSSLAMAMSFIAIGTFLGVLTMSMLAPPSAYTAAQEVIDLNQIKPGTMEKFMHSYDMYAVIHRTPEQIKWLKKNTLTEAFRSDLEKKQQQGLDATLRSLNDEYFVFEPDWVYLDKAGNFHCWQRVDGGYTKVFSSMSFNSDVRKIYDESVVGTGSA